MTDRQTRRRAEEGFTLLELLISITILALIMVALTGGVRFAGQAWNVQEQRNARQGDVNAVQNVLRQMIASGSGFDGDAVSLKFVGRLPLALSRGGLFDIELYSAGDKLVLRWQPHFKGPNAGLERNETNLLKGIEAFDVAYYVAPQGWQHLVNGKSKPPILINVGLHLAGGQAWPPLVVAPPVNAPATSKD